MREAQRTAKPEAQQTAKRTAKPKAWQIALLLGVGWAAASAVQTVAAAEGGDEVNLYTDRQEVFLRPLILAFEEESGVHVNILFAKSGLLERMKAEGEASPADVIMAVDAGRLEDFVLAGLVAPYRDEGLKNSVPPGLATDNWVAVTRRARLLFVRRGEYIADYNDLATAKSAGGVCIRGGRHAYNIGLFADMLARKGEDGARAWLAGVKRNLARSPQGNDRRQILDVAAGRCAVGVANSYYYFQLIKDAETRALLERTVDVVVPPQAHINVTGVALAARAPHRENALRLMRFLTGKKAQEIYARENGEFPARADAALPPALAPFRRALEDAAPLADISRYRARASELVEETGFDR